MENGNVIFSQSVHYGLISYVGNFFNLEESNLYVIFEDIKNGLQTLGVLYLSVHLLLN